jgi:hypothetical protein
MYVDHAPVANFRALSGATRVIVLEEKDTNCTPEAVIELARRNDAVSVSGEDGKEIFWVVYADQPRIVRDMTERALRSSIKSGAR